jgi:hypothetical protein
VDQESRGTGKFDASETERLRRPEIRFTASWACGGRLLGAY